MSVNFNTVSTIANSAKKKLDDFFFRCEEKSIHTQKLSRAAAVVVVSTENKEKIYL
jgi:hypothetical protein